VLCNQSQYCIEVEVEGDVVIDNCIIENEIYCLPCQNAPTCSSKLSFLRSCGHKIDNAACSYAFAWLCREKETSCDNLVDSFNPLCLHSCKVRYVSLLQDWQPWDDNRVTNSGLNIINNIQYSNKPM